MIYILELVVEFKHLVCSIGSDMTLSFKFGKYPFSQCLFCQLLGLVKKQARMGK
mgnify:CR=1 FL=1